MLNEKKHVVVIGNEMVRLRFCEKMLEYDAFHEYRLTALGEESQPAYDRVALSSCFQWRDRRRDYPLRSQMVCLL